MTSFEIRMFKCKSSGDYTLAMNGLINHLPNVEKLIIPDCGDSSLIKHVLMMMD